MVASKEIQSLRSLSAIYSSSTFKRILSDGSLCTIEGRILRYKHLILEDHSSVNFSHFLSALYKKMCANYCNEYVFKNILYYNIIKKYSLATTALLSEFKIAKSIADLVLINGEVKVFELKTDLDTLSRLDVQLTDYKKVAEKVNIVVSSKYINQVLSLYKETNYGVLEIVENSNFIEHRQAISDKSLFEFSALFKLLRKDEYLSMVRDEFNISLTLPNTILYKECFNLLKTIEIERFQSLVFQKLKRRNLKEYSLSDEYSLPSELGFLCHLLNLKADDLYTLNNLLNTVI